MILKMALPTILKMSKIKSISELESICIQARNQNQKIATTNGAFDIFHAGHAALLEFAKSRADLLIVLLNSDESIRRYKSEKRPIIEQEYRVKVVSSNEHADFVCVFSELTPADALEKIKPDYHFKTSEYKEDIPEKPVVEKYGGKVIFVDKFCSLSTTGIINTILERYRDENIP